MEAWWDYSTTLVLQWVAINSLEETGEAREVLGSSCVLRSALIVLKLVMMKTAESLWVKTGEGQQGAGTLLQTNQLGRTGTWGILQTPCQKPHSYQPLYSWVASAWQMAAGNIAQQRGSI